MSNPRPVLPRDLRDLLDESGVDWSAEYGSRHVKVRVGGALVACLSMNYSGAKKHTQRNTEAAIRRAIRAHKQGPDNLSTRRFNVPVSKRGDET